MKKSILKLAITALAVVLFGGAAYAADCPGGWQVIPGYNSGMGAPCQHLGLNSHSGTCRPGDQFETLCDDASGGRYKTCQGRPCQRGNSGGGGNAGFGGGGNAGFPPPPQQQNNQPPCAGWDYSYNQPCPPGYVNRDCRGGCER